MKAPAFGYRKAQTIEQALRWLSEEGDDARLLAGGQSLLPALNLRLSQPSWLIDIGALSELRGVAINGAVLRLGALVTHREIEQSPLVARHLPLLARAAPYVAHVAIRNRGTIGGSLALADPAAEYPAVALASEAVIVLRSLRGERRVAASEYFQGLYQTAMAADEMLISVEFPLRSADQRCGFEELARRHGDYALTGLAAEARLGPAGEVLALRLAFFAVADRPVLAVSAAEALRGTCLDPHAVALAKECLARDLAPVGDLQAGSASKLHWARVLLGRALGAVRPPRGV
jgi:carbon-monoxide dehydrogenase medium subunit